MKDVLARLQSELTLDSRHRYFLGGQQLPSVTQVLKNLSKDALVPWAAKVQQEADIEAIRRALPLVSDPAPILAPVAHAWRRQSYDAADLGHEVHALIEAECGRMLGKDVTSPRVSDQARIVFSGWEQWAESVGLEPIVMEQRVYARQPSPYAGTFDLLCRLKTYGDRLWVLDWKSTDGKVIYPEYELQSIAYRGALIEHGIEAHGMVVKLPKKKLTTEIKGYEVAWNTLRWNAWAGLLDVHSYVQGRK